ncbi:MAG: type IV toxin-antitoxin system AbiEi family antitoxin domain-containing protein [Bacteroidota bacterium]|nr:type IV toxin-antitoxin system AbiEi family antitoxin domain-containing protein [Bacteroidota bacterium]
MMIAKEIRTIFVKNKGYARMKDLKLSGIHTRKIAAARKDGVIERIKPGLYKLVDYPWDEFSGFSDIYTANSNSVICLVSACEYYGLTTFSPSEISVALPRNTHQFKLTFPPIKVYFFTMKYYGTGITTVKSKSGTFKIYSIEKTLVDLFRYRKKTGDDIVLESLKNYLAQNKRNINKLLECAQQCGVQNKMLPYIKAMVV